VYYFVQLQLKAYIQNPSNVAKFVSVGKTESVIKVVDGPVQEPPQEQLSDYEPPSLDKLNISWIKTFLIIILVGQIWMYLISKQC
jgi:hypothetical protein